MRRPLALTTLIVALAASAVAAGALAPVSRSDASGPPWGPEAPNVNLEAILRPVDGGEGFGHVKFRQPNDEQKIVYLGTWVRDLAPSHGYLLQRAVDTNLDGICSSTAWLTLGLGSTPQAVTTDDSGTASTQLFRDLAAVPVGTTFDIHFRLVDASSFAPVLESGCYQFTVSL